MSEKKESVLHGAKKGLKSRKAAGGEHWLKYGIAFFLVVVLGFGLEYFCNVPVLKRQNRGIREISMDTVIAEGFTRTEEGFLLTEDVGKLTIALDGAYVDRFVYSFAYDYLLNLKAYICYYNAYGEADPGQDLLLEDFNPRCVDSSSLKIGKKTESIVLSVDRALLEGLEKEDGKEMSPLLFTGFSVENVPAFNWYRLGFFWVVLGLGAFFWLFRGYLGRHVEAGFLAVCLSVGILMIYALPVNKIGYDEEVHLYRVMGLASFPQGMNINQTIFNFMQPSVDTWPKNQPGSAMEQQALREYLNENSDYKTGSIFVDADMPAMTIASYLPMALVMKLCKGFSLPWGIMFTLGKLGNLLVYGLLMYEAIKRTPVGKVMMSIIGLLPSSLFMACTYSYDPWVMGWLYLGAACFLKELLTPEKKISLASYGGMLVCFLLGCSAKAVYAPVVLIMLLLPAGKFKDERQKWLMRAGIVFLFLGLMASFVLPVLIAPKATGDARGGATSEVGQMSYVLGHFFGYLQILFYNIFANLPKMVFGKDIFSIQGHLADSPYTWFAMGLVAYTVITDTRTTAQTELKLWQKFWIFLMLGASVLLVWTSMYIAYTVPGQVVIAGVQGRYYLPILYLLYLLVNSRLVVAHMKNMWYHTGVLAASAGLLLTTMWMTVIVPMCM
jgi:uncharacterized membrane protein